MAGDNQNSVPSATEWQRGCQTSLIEESFPMGTYLWTAYYTQPWRHPDKGVFLFSWGVYKLVLPCLAVVTGLHFWTKLLRCAEVFGGKWSVSYPVIWYSFSSQVDKVLFCFLLLLDVWTTVHPGLHGKRVARVWYGARSITIWIWQIVNASLQKESYLPPWKEEETQKLIIRESESKLFF